MDEGEEQSGQLIPRESEEDLAIAAVGRSQDVVAPHNSQCKFCRPKLIWFTSYADNGLFIVSLKGGDFSGASIGPQNFHMTRQEGFAGSDLRKANFGVQNIQYNINVSSESEALCKCNLCLDCISTEKYCSADNKGQPKIGNEEGENETEHFIQLSSNIKIFPSRDLSKNGSVFVGEQTSKICEPKLIAVKYYRYNETNLREAKILQRLSNHENVVSVFHSDMHSEDVLKYTYIAMELCLSKNLREYVEENQIPFDGHKSISHAMQITQGLEFIHKNDIIHRDLKPDNILLSLDGETLKIADFGLSKELNKGRSITFQSCARVGTDGYRAPETYNSDVISKQADIFALGLVIFFVWSDGKHPFGDDPDDWNSNIKRNRNRDISQILLPNVNVARELVEKMLEFRPRARPSAAQILQDLGTVFSRVRNNQGFLLRSFSFPVSVPVLQFISQKPRHLQALKSRFNEIATISLCQEGDPGDIICDPLQCGYWRNQEEFDTHCQGLLLNFTAGYTTNTVSFKALKLNKLRARNIDPVFNEDYETDDNADVIVKWKTGESTVTITGLNSAVEATKANIHLCYSYSVTELDLPKEKYRSARMLKHCGIVQLIRNEYNDIFVKCDDEESKMLLSGRKEDITDAKILALEELHKVQKRSLKELNSAVFQYISDVFEENGILSDVIQRALVDNGIEACIVLDVGIACVMASTKEIFEMAFSKLQQLVVSRTITTDRDVVELLNTKQSEVNRIFQKHRCKVYRDLIKVEEKTVFQASMHPTRVKFHHLPMAGMFDKVDLCVGELEDLLVDRLIKRTVIPMPFGVGRYIFDRLDSFKGEKCLERQLICGLTDEDGVGVFVEGRRSIVESATKEIIKIKESFASQDELVVANNPWFRAYCRTVDGKMFINGVGYDHDSVVLMDSCQSKTWALEEASVTGAQPDLVGQDFAYIAKMKVYVYQGTVSQENFSVNVFATQWNSAERTAIRVVGGPGITSHNPCDGKPYRDIFGSNNYSTGIIHLLKPADSQEIQDGILKVLNEVKRRGQESVSLPVFYKEDCGLSAMAVGRAMRKAFESFAEQHPETKHLHVIRVVVPECMMVQDFKKSIFLTEEEYQVVVNDYGNSESDFFNPLSEDCNENTVKFFLYSRNMSNIDLVKTNITDMARSLLKNAVILDMRIEKIADVEKHMIREEAVQNNVSLTDHSIRGKIIKQYRLEGPPERVDKVHKYISHVLEEVAAAEVWKTQVLWQKLQSGEWTDLSPRITLLLERAFQACMSGDGPAKVSIPELAMRSIVEDSYDVAIMEVDSHNGIKEKIRRLVKSKELGKEGGLVPVGDCSIEVPPGALDESAELDIVIKHQYTALPKGYFAVSHCMDFTSTQNTFRNPVICRMPVWCEPGENSKTADVLYCDNGVWKKLTSVQLTNKRFITFETSFFSRFIVAIQTAGEWTEASFFIRVLIFYNRNNEFLYEFCPDSDASEKNRKDVNKLAGYLLCPFPVPRRSVKLNQQLHLKLEFTIPRCPIGALVFTLGPSFLDTWLSRHRFKLNEFDFFGQASLKSHVVDSQGDGESFDATLHYPLEDGSWKFDWDRQT